MRGGSIRADGRGDNSGSVPASGQASEIGTLMNSGSFYIQSHKMHSRRTESVHTDFI